MELTTYITHMQPALPWGLTPPKGWSAILGILFLRVFHECVAHRCRTAPPEQAWEGEKVPTCVFIKRNSFLAARVAVPSMSELMLLLSLLLPSP